MGLNEASRRVKNLQMLEELSNRYEIRVSSKHMLVWFKLLNMKHPHVLGASRRNSIAEHEPLLSGKVANQMPRRAPARDLQRDEARSEMNHSQV